MWQKLTGKTFQCVSNLLYTYMTICFCVIFFTNKSIATTYLDRDSVKKFINKVHNDKNIPIAKIESIVKNAKKSDKALQLISQPIETTTDFNSYKNIFITDKMITKGIAFWKKNAEILTYFNKNMGVPPAIIVSLLGVESRFGENSGEFKVLDVLATLSFDFPKRAKFFQNELMHFLVFLCEHGYDSNAFTGSYAGAMGMPQFMPSSYKQYAISYNSKEVPDIWRKDHDSIASIANYIHKNGWKKSGMVATKVTVSSTKSEQVCNNKDKLKQTVGSLKKNGWLISENINDKETVLPMKHKGTTGDDFWIGFHNFEVITRYNKSQIYALTVHLLAEELNKRYFQ